MDKIRDYINECIGIDAKVNSLNRQYLLQIPIYLRNGYEWFEIEILDRKFLLAYIREDDDFSIAAINKQLLLIEEKLNMFVVVCVDQLEPYNRQRLVKAKRGFIVPGKQMFVPNLFLDFKEYKTIKKVNRTERFLPLSQTMVIYHLLNKGKKAEIEDRPFKDIAALFKTNTINVSRAIENLQQLDLVEVTKRGRSKMFRFVDDRKQLWAKALADNYAVDPVHKVVYSDQSKYVQHLLLAGDTALAEYTDMNPSRQVTRAMDQESFAHLKKNTDIEFHDYEDEYAYQIWKYDPDFMNKITGEYDAKVDPLSLYLTYINDRDERIEMELDKLIDRIW